MSPEYTAALATHNAAYEAYEDACEAYRAKLIDDAAFFAARAIKAKADETFDVAWHEELAREYANPSNPDDEQLSLI